MINLLEIDLIIIAYIFMKIIALMSKLLLFEKTLRFSIIRIRLKPLEGIPESYSLYFDTKHFRLLE